MGISIEFKGKDIEEIAVVSDVIGDAEKFVSVGDIIMRIDPRYFRPAEVDTLLGDPTKARRKLVGSRK